MGRVSNCTAASKGRVLASAGRCRRILLVAAPSRRSSPFAQGTSAESEEFASDEKETVVVFGLSICFEVQKFNITKAGSALFRSTRKQRHIDNHQSISLQFDSGD